MDWYDCRPHSLTVKDGGVHRRPPKAAQQVSASGGLAAALAAASQDCTPRWKIDPLRSPSMGSGPAAGDAPDTRADGGHCPRAHAGSAGGAAWRLDAARAGLPHCRLASRSGNRGHNCSRWRTAARTVDSGASAGRGSWAGWASRPPGLALWTTAACLCEALNVCWASALWWAAEPHESPGGNRGFRFSSQLPEAYSPPLPPRYARDDDVCRPQGSNSYGLR
jgi:hypothetical protein